MPDVVDVCKSGEPIYNNRVVLGVTVTGQYSAKTREDRDHTGQLEALLDPRFDDGNYYGV